MELKNASIVLLFRMVQNLVQRYNFEEKFNFWKKILLYKISNIISIYKFNLLNLNLVIENDFTHFFWYSESRYRLFKKIFFFILVFCNFEIFYEGQALHRIFLNSWQKNPFYFPYFDFADRLVALIQSIKFYDNGF